MLINWRALFDDQRIPWRDKGPNTSRGNINVACPWCGNDPSFHLGVAEARDAYYCFRDPNRHSGRDPLRLLIKLGISRELAARLIRRFTIDSSGVGEQPLHNSGKALDRPVIGWNRFVNASSSREAISYLLSRGFCDPQLACLRFDLRVATEGQWANRVLIPYYKDDEVETWTGRAMREHMRPKYLMQKLGHDAGMVYSPIRAFYPRRRLIIVEGQMDALKIAAAVDEKQYLVVALAGKFLNASKIVRILDLIGGSCADAIVALDDDVAHSTTYGIISELASHLRSAYISRARLPSCANDPADLSLPEIAVWLPKQFHHE